MDGEFLCIVMEFAEGGDLHQVQYKKAQTNKFILLKSFLFKCELF
jgi:hypothetical protein